MSAAIDGEISCLLLEVFSLQNVPNTDGYSMLSVEWNERLFGKSTRCDPYLEFVCEGEDSQFSQPVEDMNDTHAFKARALFLQKPGDPLKVTVHLRDWDPYAEEHENLGQLVLNDVEASDGGIPLSLGDQKVMLQAGKMYTGRFRLRAPYAYLNEVPLGEAVTCSVRVAQTTVHANVLRMIQDIQGKDPRKIPNAKASHFIAKTLNYVGVVSVSFWLGFLLRPLLVGGNGTSEKPSAVSLAAKLGYSLLFGS